MWDSKFGEALIEEVEEEEVEDEVADLSLLLTSQNPARIDVRTLRNKKVNTEEYRVDTVANVDSSRY